MKRFYFFILLFVIISFATNAQSFPVDTVVDTSLSRFESIAKFPGGTGAWTKYLTANLNAGVATMDKAPVGKYTVRVQFMVDVEGRVSDVKPVFAPERCPACAVEAVRVIRAGPKWIPAMQFGKPVEYRATQQITFQVSENSMAYGMVPFGPPLIQFRDISLNEAIKEAGEKGKIVFAQFISAACPVCNETSDVAFASKSLAEQVDQKCVPIKIQVNSADRLEFIKKYNPSNQIGTFFISADNELLSHFARTSTRADDYLAELEKAYQKQLEGRVTLKELNEEWKANPQNFIAMELNLSRRQSFGWFTDALLEEYVKRLPQDSLRSTRTLAFIASMAPSLFSVANGILRRDHALFNQAWYSLHEVKRVEINRQLILKSINKAIAVKSQPMAEMVATFTKRTYEKEPAEKAQQGYDKQMLIFYKGMRDTATFLQKAVAYYDHYFMSIDLKEILATDSLNRKIALDTAKSIKVEDPQHKGRFYTRRSVSIIPQGTVLGSELIQGAQGVYMRTNDRDYLHKAVTWAKRAGEFSPFADMDGLLPRLTYVLGENAKAIELQKEAIKKSQMVRRNTAALQATLELMQAGAKLTERIAY